MAAITCSSPAIEISEVDACQGKLSMTSASRTAHLLTSLYILISPFEPMNTTEAFKGCTHAKSWAAQPMHPMRALDSPFLRLLDQSQLLKLRCLLVTLPGELSIARTRLKACPVMTRTRNKQSASLDFGGQ
eukprot:5688178-Amphidinium_carterae.1